MELKRPASITKLELREGKVHYGSMNASPCVIDGTTYEPGTLVLRCFIGTMGKDRLLHGHYVCRPRTPKEADLPQCEFSLLPSWGPKAAPPVATPKPVKTNTRKAVKRNGVHTQN